MRIGTEVCDDGNTSSGDGCNESCTAVETEYVCTGGSSTTPDVCVKIVNSTVSVTPPEISQVTETSTSYSGTSTAIIASGGVINGATAVVGPSAGAYTMAFQMQNLMVSPLITGDMDSQISDSYESMDYMMMNFNFLPDSFSVSGVSRRNLNNQSNPALVVLGLKSGSAIVNIGKILFVLFILMFVHLIILAGYVLSVTFRPGSIVYKIFKVAYDIFSFHVYVRLIILMYFFLLMCCFSEMAMDTNTDDPGSMFAAVMLFLFCVAFLAFHVFLWVISRKGETFAKLHRFSEGFRGLKPNLSSRFFPIAMMLKTFGFVIMLTVCHKAHFAAKLTIILALQLAFIIYVVIVKPFVSLRDTIIEILGGCFIFGAFFSLYFLNTADKWTAGVIYAYLTAIILYLIAVITVSIVWFVYLFIKWRQQKRQEKYKEKEKLPHLKLKNLESENEYKPASEVPESEVGVGAGGAATGTHLNKNGRNADKLGGNIYDDFVSPTIQRPGGDEDDL